MCEFNPSSQKAVSTCTSKCWAPDLAPSFMISKCGADYLYRACVKPASNSQPQDTGEPLSMNSRTQQGIVACMTSYTDDDGHDMVTKATLLGDRRMRSHSREARDLPQWPFGC